MQYDALFYFNFHLNVDVYNWNTACQKAAWPKNWTWMRTRWFVKIRLRLPGRGQQGRFDNNWREEEETVTFLNKRTYELYNSEMIDKTRPISILSSATDKTTRVIWTYPWHVRQSPHYSDLVCVCCCWAARTSYQISVDINGGCDRTCATIIRGNGTSCTPKVTTLNPLRIPYPVFSITAPIVLLLSPAFVWHMT